MILGTPTQTATAPRLGARAPQRQALQSRVTRPVTALLPTPGAAVVPVLTPPAVQDKPQDNAWRRRAIELAWENDWQSQATYSGHSARGLEVYAVPSSQHGHLTYRVTFTPDAGAQTVADGRYVCSCIAASHGRACRHAGAALLLADLMAEARDSIKLAEAEHMSWAWAIHDGWSASADHLAWFRVGESQMRQWREVRVIWDTTRNVAVWCDCGRRICPHIGAVALRVDKERRDYLRRMREFPDPDWTHAFDPLWDGAVLPAALV